MANYISLKGGKYKLYLAALQNDKLNLLKVGVTKFVDAKNRFVYNHQAFTEGIEQDSYINIFPNITICDSVIVESKERAEELEAIILSRWGDKDFWIESKLSGITESRKYTPQRYAIAKNVINGAGKR